MSPDLIQELRDGLEGVTPGPWWPGHLADDSSTCNCTSVLAENGLMGSIAQVTVDNGLRVGDGGNDGPPVEEAKRNLLHIARCSPDNIRALLDALTAEDTALAEARAELERLAKENAQLSETFIDDTGLSWSPPTAWAYYAACRTRDAHQHRAEAAEASLADLAAENERLRKALEPFAAMSRRFDAAARGFNVEPRPDSYVPRTDFTHGEIRNAARALQDEAGKK